MNPPSDAPNDWQVWRGTVTAELKSLFERVSGFERTCTNCVAGTRSDFEHVFEKVDKISDRVRRIEIRVAFFAGAAGFFGTIAGAFVVSMLRGG